MRSYPMNDRVFNHYFKAGGRVYIKIPIGPAMHAELVAWDDQGVIFKDLGSAAGGAITFVPWTSVAAISPDPSESKQSDS
jgi:hypothetical protein